MMAGAGWTQEPLSAIDWLSDSIRERPEQGVVDEPPATFPEEVPEISVGPIEGPLPDAVGLLPASVTGLPPDLWQGSRTFDLAHRIQRASAIPLPSIQEFFYVLLLAELAPPADSGSGADLLLARLDALLSLGALEQAAALIERAGSRRPEVFRRAFDISLLLRNEDRTCATMRSTPSLAPTFPARIFCLAHGGDWEGAVLAFDTGRSLGFLKDDEEQLLAHFLDLSTSHDVAPLPIPTQPTPLVFRIYEAIGLPLPTTSLPRAFAHSDLHSSSGWKTQIESAERLARTGALDANRLMELYRKRKPAASGGVWDRVAAIQALDAALLTGNPDILSRALTQAWEQMQVLELEAPFARTYCPRLKDSVLLDGSREIALTLCLLAGADTNGLTLPKNASRKLALAFALSRNDIAAETPGNPELAAIHAGFQTTETPMRLRSLVDEGRTGEAMLRSIDMMTTAAQGDLDELTDALIFLRSVGFEDAARQAAIDLLLLRRNG